MTKETLELEADLRCVASEIWPMRDASYLTFSNEILVLGVLIRRELSLAHKTVVCPTRYADGLEGQATARSKGRRERVE